MGFEPMCTVLRTGALPLGHTVSNGYCLLRTRS